MRVLQSPLSSRTESNIIIVPSSITFIVVEKMYAMRILLHRVALRDFCVRTKKDEFEQTKLGMR